MSKYDLSEKAEIFATKLFGYWKISKKLPSFFSIDVTYVIGGVDISSELNSIDKDLGNFLEEMFHPSNHEPLYELNQFALIDLFHLERSKFTHTFKIALLPYLEEAIIDNKINIKYLDMPLPDSTDNDLMILTRDLAYILEKYDDAENLFVWNASYDLKWVVTIHQKIDSSGDNPNIKFREKWGNSNSRIPNPKQLLEAGYVTRVKEETTAQQGVVNEFYKLTELGISVIDSKTDKTEIQTKTTYEIFVSHSSKNEQAENFVNELANNLSEVTGKKVFTSTRANAFKSGSDWYEDILDFLTYAQSLVLILK